MSTLLELPTYLHGKKASDVFLEYAEPVISISLADMDREPTIIEVDKILKLPWYIWNKVVDQFSDSKNINIRKLLEQMQKVYNYNMPPGARELMNSMEERKKTEFKQYQYYVAQCEVYKKSNNEISVRLSHIQA